jgi:hypothetical protein
MRAAVVGSGTGLGMAENTANAAPVVAAQSVIIVNSLAIIIFSLHKSIDKLSSHVNRSAELLNT